jgi:hypothetical protein
LSSAILYGAIVVIWAGVLIPRWLRRETSSETVVSDPVAGPQSASAEAREAPEAPGEAPAAPRPAAAPRPGRRPAPPPQRDAERARVLGARRRLLGMLLALAIGAGALAEMRLAAWWVVLPPSVMLGGYLLLLREASRADAERRSPQRTRPATSVPVGPVGPAVPATPVAPVAAAKGAPVAAPAPDAQIIDITGRVGEEFYDQYADAKLRAVGD